MVCKGTSLLSARALPLRSTAEYVMERGFGFNTVLELLLFILHMDKDLDRGHKRLLDRWACRMRLSLSHSFSISCPSLFFLHEAS